MHRLAASLFLVLAGGITVSARQSTEITGDYVEGRSNHVFGCYCEWSGEAQTTGREAVVAWHFRSGEFRGTPIAGMKAAAVIVGDRTLSKGAPPRKSSLFLDGSAHAQQRAAVERLLREKFGSLLGEVLSVRSTPIDFQRTLEKAVLRVGELLTLALRKARLPEDALQGAVLWYDPFIPLTESTLGITQNSRYWGDDFNYRWNTSSEFGVTGYFGAFRITP